MIDSGRVTVHPVLLPELQVRFPSFEMCLPMCKMQLNVFIFNIDVKT